jgi:translation initiation factor IF-2
MSFLDCVCLGHHILSCCQSELSVLRVELERVSAQLVAAQTTRQASQEELKRQAQLVVESQSRYHNELSAHADTAKSMAALRAEVSQCQQEVRIISCR